MRCFISFGLWFGCGWRGRSTADHPAGEDQGQLQGQELAGREAFFFEEEVEQVFEVDVGSRKHLPEER